MKLLHCECAVAELARLRRPLWMRLIPMVRLCYCRRCRRRVLAIHDPQWRPYFVYTLYRRRSRPPTWEVTVPLRQ